MKRLVVHIDRLVMKGLRREDASSVAESLREHLVRTLSTPQMAQRILERGDVPRIQAGKVHLGSGGLGSGGAPARIGARAANAIVAGVKP
jgi:hypothetical protein